MQLDLRNRKMRRVWVLNRESIDVEPALYAQGFTNLGDLMPVLEILGCLFESNEVTVL